MHYPDGVSDRAPIPGGISSGGPSPAWWRMPPPGSASGGGGRLPRPGRDHHPADLRPAGRRGGRRHPGHRGQRHRPGRPGGHLGPQLRRVDRGRPGGGRGRGAAGPAQHPVQGGRSGLHPAGVGGQDALHRRGLPRHRLPEAAGRGGVVRRAGARPRAGGGPAHVRRRRPGRRRPRATRWWSGRSSSRRAGCARPTWPPAGRPRSPRATSPTWCSPPGPPATPRGP